MKAGAIVTAILLLSLVAVAVTDDGESARATVSYADCSDADSLLAVDDSDRYLEDVNGRLIVPPVPTYAVIHNGCDLDESTSRIIGDTQHLLIGRDGQTPWPCCGMAAEMESGQQARS